MIGWWWIGKDFSGSGRSLILRYYPGIRLEGLRNTTKTSIRVAGLRVRDSNPGPPEYELVVALDHDVRQEEDIL
jgi:hypothetical protein